jgi:hypothetical protein
VFLHSETHNKLVDQDQLSRSTINKINVEKLNKKQIVTWKKKHYVNPHAIEYIATTIETIDYLAP